MFSSDHTKRYDYLDELLEKEALDEYDTWTIHALLAALARGDQERISFYNALERTVVEDLMMVQDEYAPKIRASSAYATDGSIDKEEPVVLHVGTSIDEPLSASSDTAHGRQLNPSTTGRSLASSRRWSHEAAAFSSKSYSSPLSTPNYLLPLLNLPPMTYIRLRAQHIHSTLPQSKPHNCCNLFYNPQFSLSQP